MSRLVRKIKHLILELITGFIHFNLSTFDHIIDTLSTMDVINYLWFLSILPDCPVPEIVIHNMPESRLKILLVKTEVLIGGYYCLSEVNPSPALLECQPPLVYN